MSSKTASKLNLTQCLAIQANQYRNVDNSKDYQSEEIDQRIYELQAGISAVKANYLRKLLDREQKQYDEFLKSQGVPEFHFTWNDETDSYIEF